MPRINMPGQNRAQWYDRSPLAVSRNFIINTAPHGVSTVLTYNTPANRRFSVGGGQIFVSRNSAPTADGYIVLAITYNSAFYSTESLVIISTDKIAVDAFREVILPGGLMLDSGDVLRGVSADSSTGGFVWYTVSFWGTEFDA